jgi:hypothetical protein
VRIKKDATFSARYLARNLGYGNDGRKLTPTLKVHVDAGRIKKISNRLYKALEDIEIKPKDGR